MTKTNKQLWTISTFKISNVVYDKLTKYNREHPNDKINVSGTCREAIERKLEWRIQNDKKYEGVDKT